MTLTRREFLQVLGISAAVPFVDPLSRLVLPGTASGDSPVLLARLFESIDSHMTDSVHPILAVSDTGYQLPFGWIRKTQAQPIPVAEYRPPTSVVPDSGIRIGEWVSAAVPAAPLYEKPNVLADIRSLYWGETIRVTDILPPANPGDVAWLELNYDFNEGYQCTVWSQAHFWHAVNLTEPPRTLTRSAVIDRETSTIYAYDGDQLAFSVPVLLGYAQPAGEYRLNERKMNNYSLISEPLSTIHNGRLLLLGSALRCMFGAKNFCHGYGTALPIYAARALYQFLPDGIEIRVI